LPTWRVLGRNLPAATGAYLRIFPLGVSRRAIQQLNRGGYPAALNVHPWELDPEQPRVGGGRFGGLTHYANLRSTGRRLEALLGCFRFASMRASLQAVGLLPGGTGDARAASV
jgi:hypothetical protein